MNRYKLIDKAAAPVMALIIATALIVKLAQWISTFV